MEQDQFFKLTDKQVSKSKMTKNNRKSKVHKSEIMSVKEFTMEKQRCWNDIDFKKTEEMLLNSVIHRKVPLHKYKNESEDISFFLSKLVSLLKGKRNYNYFVLYLDNNLKAIFKPNKGLEAMASALLAYHFSQFMNLKLVPPTVIREINGEKGAVQLFIDGVDGRNYDAVKKLHPTQKSDIYTFYFVLGDHNVHKPNQLFGKNCREPALIDNENIIGNTFIAFGDYPFIALRGIKAKRQFQHLELKHFPMSQVKSVKKPITYTKIKRIFHGLRDDRLRIMLDTDLDDNKFYYVKWKGHYWLKQNNLNIKHIFKDMVPSAFQKSTLEKLKKLKKLDLENIKPSLFDYPYPIPENVISGILYRKDLLLKQNDVKLSNSKPL